MVAADDRILLDWDALEVGEGRAHPVLGLDLRDEARSGVVPVPKGTSTFQSGRAGPVELTQEMIRMYDTYRQGVMDAEASFPTISHKVDVKTVQRPVPGRRFGQRPLRVSLLQPAHRRQDDHGAGVDRRQVPAPGQELHRYRGGFG